MIYENHAFGGSVTASEAARIRQKVRKNMGNFLGHREFPLNENTVRDLTARWIDAVLANPEIYGEAQVEVAEQTKRHHEKHGPARHINTPAYKLHKLIADGEL